MDNEYNYGNNEEKREEPARIEPPVPEDGIIEEAAQTEQRTEQENTSYYEKPPVYESSTQESQTRDSQSYDSQSYDSQLYDSQTYGAPTYEQPDEESKKQPRRHMRKEKERKPIVTNNHVVEGSSTLTVTFVDEESVEAQVKGTNSNIDLAVVAVQLDQIKDSTMKEIKTATLGDSDAIRVGEPAIAIGNALGYGQSVTNGIISAKDRTVDGFETTLIQTNAAINPGNSGGALLNAKGEVIGINTVKVNADAVEGMGYAIPISDVTDVINDLMNRQTRTKVDESERGALGISGTDVDSQSAQVYNMPEGVFISDVTKDGGAEKAGLTKGSIITEFDGTKIDSMDTLKSQLEYYKAGETVDVTVQVPEKNGEYKEQTVQVTLGEAAK